jgi:hypothetical protein
MTSRYTIWMIGGREPVWGDLAVRDTKQISADCWSVLVEGNGADLVKYIKSRSDLFFCYVRA